MPCDRSSVMWWPLDFARGHHSHVLGAHENGGAGGRNRTRDQLITNQPLCQLSYAGVYLNGRPFGAHNNIMIVLSSRKRSP